MGCEGVRGGEVVPAVVKAGVGAADGISGTFCQWNCLLLIFGSVCICLW